MSRGPRIRLRRRRAPAIEVSPSRSHSVRARRCAFCHEDIGRALGWTCEGCGCTLHDFCCREARRCVGLGCESEWRWEPTFLIHAWRQGEYERGLWLTISSSVLTLLALFSVLGFIALFEKLSKARPFSEMALWFICATLLSIGALGFMAKAREHRRGIEPDA